MIPFYVALNQRIAGDSRLYELRYFHSQHAAEIDAAEVPGSYVVQTTPSPAIWRATRPMDRVKTLALITTVASAFTRGR